MLGGELGVGQGVDDRLAASLDERTDELLQLASRDGDLEMLGTVLIGGDEGQIDGGLHRAGEFDLGLFGGFLQALEGHRVFAQIDAFGAFEFVGQIIDEDLVEVVAAEVGVAVDAEDFEDAVADVEHGDVERSAAEVEDADFFILLFIEPVGEGRGGGLGQHAEDLKAGDFAGVLGGLALRVVEIRRDGDDRLGDFFAEIILGGLFEIAQDHGADGLGGVFLAADFHLHEFVGRADDGVGDHLLFRGDFGVAPAHETLDAEDCIFWVGNLLMLGVLTDDAFAFVGESHDRRREPAALGVDQHLGLISFHDGDYAVGRS